MNLPLLAGFQAFLQNSHTLVHLGLLLLLGYVGGRVASRLRAPRVSGYIVTGMLFGPSILGVFHEELVKEDLVLVTDIALSVIAFSIGGSLVLAKLKRLGKEILWITPIQALAAFFFTTVLVAIALPLIGAGWTDAVSPLGRVFFPIALVIGAISAATAPATTLAIIHEYRAKGPLTTVLLGVVALDDGLTILLFAFAMSVAQALTARGTLSWQNVAVLPGLHIVAALALGAAGGLCLRWFLHLVRRKEAMLGVVLGSIFLMSGLAMGFGSSPLLANMILGFMVANFVRSDQDLFAVVEGIEEPIFAMFFTLAGAHLDLRVVQTAGSLALVISLGRFGGKLLGCRLGGEISDASRTVKRYLGLGLLPAAGVTVGLVLLAAESLGPSRMSEMMVSAVLGSVILNELLAPILVRYALWRAGETGKV
ncbi:MAG: cation:proton antiporter [Deltaproteobacteria bacterium]|nr:cation:proton antiporter [Deltaproteobacteria bacterium]